MLEPPVCLTIAGLDPSGGAGIVADIKTFSAFGCFAAAAVSSVTFQNSKSVFGSVHQTPESLRRQIEPVLADCDVVSVKTGMLPTVEIIEEIAQILASASIPNIVVDPVVRSTSGFDLIDDQALRALIETLFPIACIATPNIPEAERICGFKIESESDIFQAGEKILATGVGSVLIKGGHAANEPRATDYFFSQDGCRRFEAERLATTSTHGTGCTLSAAIAANLALGRKPADAIKTAKDFVLQGIRDAAKIGRANGPVIIPAIWRAG